MEKFKKNNSSKEEKLKVYLLKEKILQMLKNKEKLKKMALLLEEMIKKG